MQTFYTNVSKYGNNILFRGYNQSGKRVSKKIKYQPTLYVPVDKETGWKSLFGDNVEPIKFDTIKAANHFVEKYKDVDNFKIYGTENYITQFVTEYFPMTNGSVSHDYKLIETGSFDIEVASDDGFPHANVAEKPVISIVYKSNKSNIYEVWGLQDYDTESAIRPEGTTIRYRQFSSETNLLLSFVDFIERNCPDILTGWYIRLFDIPYLINRIKKVIGERAAKRLSPWGILTKKEVHTKGGKVNDAYELVGVNQLDYMDLFVKFDYVYTFDNMKLDTVANVVLGKKKISYEEHGSLHTLYKENHQKFIDYNVRDVSLIEELDQAMGLIERAVTIAYRAGVNYADTLGTVSVWDSIIHRYLMEDNIVVPPNEPHHKVSYPGGYVKDVAPQRVDWIASFDLNSLYPNLIVQYNMSPETLLEDTPDHPSGVQHYMDNAPEIESDYVVAANGVTFSKNRTGILPKIIKQYYSDRKEVQAKAHQLNVEIQRLEGQSNKQQVDDLKRQRDKFDNEQMALKILLNSLYGATGNSFFRYFDIRIAEAITMSGQLSIKWAERAINKYLNEVTKQQGYDFVTAIDTDSLYVNLSSFVASANPEDPVDFIDKLCKKRLEPVLERAYDDLFKHMNAYDNRMKMGREVIAERGVWTAKKRYILSVYDKEGVRYTEPKLKIMGVEAIKSSTPSVCRDKLKQAFKIVLTKYEKQLQDFVKEFESEFKQLPPEDVSFPRGVSEVDKWKDSVSTYKSGVPIHVRGSIVYNKYLKDYGLDKQYEEIQDGSKIKFCYMIVPNILRENVLSYPNYIPREHDLHKYVDYDTQFKKSFKEPLRPIVEAMGWKVEKTNTLDAFAS